MYLIVLIVCCFTAAIANAMARHAYRSRETGNEPGRAFVLGGQILMWTSGAVAVVAAFAWVLGAPSPLA